MRSTSRILPAALLAALAGCSQRAAPPVQHAARPEAAPHEERIPDSAFGPALFEVLARPGPGVQRAARLREAVQVQLRRAGQYLASGHSEEGVGALEGAFLLARGDEFSRELFGGDALATLAAGASAFAQRGAEGQSEALYELLTELLPPGPPSEAFSQHLQALRRWQAETRAGGTMEAAGAALRGAQGRAGLYATRRNLESAREAIAEWLARGDALRDEQTPPRSLFEKEEYDEAFRASSMAYWALTTLYLRVGNAGGALDAIREEGLSDRTPPRLVEALRLASERDDPSAWAQLEQHTRAAEAGEAPLFGVDSALLAGARWGAAVQLYRSRPEEFAAAVPLTRLLLRHQMGEAAPLVLWPALQRSRDPRDMSFALRVVLQGLMQADAVGDLEGARRLFKNSAPLLEHASRGAATAVRPNPAELAYAMGALEARAGALSSAELHLVRAIDQSPTLEALRMLASIARQQGDFAQAENALEKATHLALQEGQAIELTEAQLASFEMLRDQDRHAEAEQALQAALQSGIRALSEARMSPALARAERALARVLELFAQPDAARRAGRRAYEASRNDPTQLATSLLDSARRALTWGDVRSARQAVRRAVAADLAAKDTVYAALWLKLLEMRLSLPSDGTASEALARIEDDTGWVARLTAWGRGRLSDERLLNAGTTTAERVEAQFYVAMARADEATRLKGLRRVAESEAIQLIEVTIARDLLAAERGHASPKLPEGVAIP